MFVSWMVLFPSQVHTYQIHNFILNGLIRVYVRMWPGVRKTEMRREENADRHREDRHREDRDQKQADQKQTDKMNGGRGQRG